MRPRINPFSDLYAECNRGTAKEKHKHRRPAPLIVDVEVTNACNFRCLMCPTGNRAMRRDTGLMSWETFVALAGKLPWGTGIRFIGWGEPTMHPDLALMISYASQCGLVTHLNTNGSLLTHSMCRDLIGAGLDSVKFSFQGATKRSYREMRNTDFYDQLIMRVKWMRHARGRGEFPFIAVSTTTTYETEEEIKAFRSDFAGLADQVSVGKTIFGFWDERAMRLPEKELDRYRRLSEDGAKDLDHPDPCPEVWDKLSIAWDGGVRVCCNDFDGLTNLGNIAKDDLSTIWRHPAIEAYRDRLAGRDYDAPLCRDCWDYQELSNAKIVAGGR